MATASRLRFTVQTTMLYGFVGVIIIWFSVPFITRALLTSAALSLPFGFVVALMAGAVRRGLSARAVGEFCIITLAPGIGMTLFYGFTFPFFLVTLILIVPLIIVWGDGHLSWVMHVAALCLIFPIMVGMIPFFRLSQSPLGQIGIVLPITAALLIEYFQDQLRSEKRSAFMLQMGLRSYGRENAALAMIGRDVLASLDVPTILPRIVHHACTLVQAQSSAILLPDPNGTPLRAVAARGPLRDALLTHTFYLHEGIIGDIASRRESAIIRDTHTDPRAATLPRGPSGARMQLMATPLLAGQQLVGVLAVWRMYDDEPFSADNMRLLDNLAQQATVAITNAHLLESARMAQSAADQANQAKSVFLANMSHELRTPLNAILGFTRIVRRKSSGVLPDKQIENLDKVLSSGEHLLKLINTVLDIAKIEAGRMDAQFAPCDVAHLLTECVEIATPLLRPEVSLFYDSAALPVITSDPAMLRQITLNLLSNAAKFTHTGQIMVAAQCVDGQIAISVTDSGIGIEPSALERIFDAFQQADSSTTRQYGGTGLGLSISRRMAQLLGGDLVAASTSDAGSVFTFTIPLTHEPPLPDGASR
jgi:signal transduction histidine kinase